MLSQQIFFMWHLMTLQIKFSLCRSKVDFIERNSKRTLKSEEVMEDFGMVDGSNKPGTISQVTRVHVQCETENKH